MLKRGKRKTAWLLSVVMLLSVLFSGNVYAADDTNTDSSQNTNVGSVQNTEPQTGIAPDQNNNVEEEENSDYTVQSEQADNGNVDQNVQDSSAVNQEETFGDSAPAEQGLINYVGVDYPYLETPAEQNIVVSYGDGSENVSDAKLIIKKDAGDTFEIDLSKREGELFLFTYSFVEDETSVYELTDFVYTQDGTEQTIHLADIGIESMFGVNEEYPGYGESSEESEELSLQEVEMSVVDVETGEVEESSDEIEDAITATANQVSTIQASRASRAAAQKSDNLVVVLDPGHGGYDGGASANGLVEKNLTLKIAQYCKAELEQYNGVSVYMTRNDDRYLDIDERVNIAADTYHADVLVSIHINSATAAANGAEVYYPNANYNPAVSEPGRNLAQQIQNQLVALGLTDRGIKVRNTVNDIYPDGSKQDYYGIIRYSKLHGFPGIIVEHAFISNPSDAAKLAQESFLQQLGIADATGIANAYGLSKINIEGSGAVTVSPDENVSTIKATITEGEEYISGLSVAVWGQSAGQNDLKWYDMQKSSDGDWTTDIKISNHKESGGYYADVYAVCNNGEKRYIDTLQFTISNLTAEVEIGTYDKASGTFEITAKNIQSPSGVKEVKFPVWKEVDQANTLYWYTAERQDDGTYKATVNIKNHGYATGTYMAHVYVTGNNGVTSSLVAGRQNVTLGDVSIEINDVSNEGRESRYQVKALNMGVYGALGMEVAVWGAVDGQNDLKWYNSQQGSDGARYAYIDIADHKESGLYYADVYANMNNGVKMWVKTLQFTISNLTAEVEIGTYDKASGTFEITAKNIQSPSGVKEVKFPVWKEVDQANTLYWYTAERQDDGTYKATVNIKNHGYATGTYMAHVYVTGNNGVTSSLVAGRQNVTLGDVSIEINDVSNEGRESRYQVKALNMGVYGALGMEVAVWGAVDGQNDLKWYNSQQGSDGARYAYIDIADHKESGLYYADVYANMNNGVKMWVKTLQFTISNLTAEVEIGTYDKASGTFEITAKNIQSPSGVKEVKFPVWKEVDQANTLYWYTAERQDDGTYKATVNIKNHGYATGTYMAHVYVTGNNGVTSSLVAGRQNVTLGDVSIEINDVSNEGRESRYQVKALNMGVYGALGMEVAVWGAVDGQNDLKWYNSQQGSDGARYAYIDIADHKESGLYYADVYANMNNGVKMWVKTLQFTISNLTAEVEIGTYDKASGTFEITAKNIQSPSGVKEVKFPVWKEVDQANTLYWYTAERQDDGTYKATVNIKNHSYKAGEYVAHVYVTGKNEVTNSLFAGRITIDEVINNELYSIMGETKTSSRQMVDYYRSIGVNYPTEALGKGGAHTIEEFCNIVEEEARVEGVKAEIVFSQIMLETGYLQFGGDVKIEQFNFGGLGATGNGVPGNSFPDVRTGIRANVQHLKCYACNEPLVNSRVDPRWGEWLRNKAPYVQWLSIPNNPYGTGWASDKDYGTKILNIISKL